MWKFNFVQKGCNCWYKYKR